MDGVDVKFEACVVVDVFPPGICLGPQELKCYNIIHQEPTGEARIDERASLVASFVVPQAAPILSRGLIDTGFRRVHPSTVWPLRLAPYRSRSESTYTPPMVKPSKLLV